MASVDFVFDNTSLEPVKNLTLKANFDEMRTWLKDALSPYSGLVVEESALAEAKNDKAKINKLKTRIDSVRKEVKRQYTAPLEVFENECKSLTQICDISYKNINDQVNLFEDKRRQEKLTEIQNYFDLIPKKHDPSYYDFQKIYDPRWTNATSRIETAQELMVKYCHNIDSDIEAILSIGSPFEQYLLGEYKNGKTISQIIAMDRQMKEAQEAKRRQEEERKRLEESRMVREMEQKIEQEASTHTVPEEPDVPDLSMIRRTVMPPEPEQEIEQHTVNIWVRGTREQLAKLADLIDEAGLQYGAL